ncbi:MAG: triose-phosphate isomerase, partial [Actinomycetes bacterium]
LVMVGHAERRAFGEDSEAEIINQLEALIEIKLPILYCIGEEHLEKDKKKRKDWFKKQLQVLRDLYVEKALIGYEPVWSIGDKGTPAEPSYVEESFQLIKEALTELERKPENFPLLYGGSVNVENAKQLASLDSCDGLFVGRSAWSKDGFRNVFEKAYSGYRSKF